MCESCGLCRLFGEEKGFKKRLRLWRNGWVSRPHTFAQFANKRQDRLCARSAVGIAFGTQRGRWCSAQTLQRLHTRLNLRILRIFRALFAIRMAYHPHRSYPRKQRGISVRGCSFARCFLFFSAFSVCSAGRSGATTDADLGAFCAP